VQPRGKHVHKHPLLIRKIVLDDIFADDEDDDVDMFGTPRSGNSFCTPTFTMSRRTSASGLLMSVGNELSSYLVKGSRQSGLEGGG
jgi:hypothetical protein